MATITALTAARMEAIEDASIVDAHLSGDDLILTNHAGIDINVGPVVGADGSPPDVQADSTTSNSIALGAKTFALTTPMSTPFPIGARVRAVGVTATNWMVGAVTASSPTSVTIQMDQINNTGTFAVWTLMYGLFDGISTSTATLLVRGGATALNIGNLTGAVALNVANNGVTLVSANLSNAVVLCTLTGNTTFNTTTMPAVGTAPLRFQMKIFQDATGSRTLTLTGFKKPGGALVLGTTPSLYSIVEFLWDGTSWNATLTGINYA